jgi:chromosome segregation ATPase
MNDEIKALKMANDLKIKQILNKISSTNTQKEIQRNRLLNRISTKKINKDLTVKEMENKVASMEADKRGKENQIRNLQRRIDEIEIEIDRINNNTNQLLQERTQYLTGNKNSENSISMLIYSNTIQQNISYLNSLKGAANDLRLTIHREKVGIESVDNRIKDILNQMQTLEERTKYELEDLEGEITNLEVEKEKRIKDLLNQKEVLEKETQHKIENLQSKIRDLESEISYTVEEKKDLELKEQNIRNIHVLQPPTPNPYPINPKTKRNVALAMAMGLFISLFLAFFLEYVFKHRGA